MSASRIILYDIPTAKGFKYKAWSPNTWKIRWVFKFSCRRKRESLHLTGAISYTLNFKGIPYKTEWIEYPDIEPLCKKLGAPPTEKKPNGRDDHYTLPMIYDPSTSKVLVDSYPIAKYLEATYPDTPKLFPARTEALQASFLSSFWFGYSFPLFMIIISRLCGALSPYSQEYFRPTREEKFGNTLEALNTPQEWEKLESAWTKLRTFFAANGEGRDTLLAGDVVTYSDIQIAAVLVWARNICGADSEDWKRIAALDGGFWGRFLQQFEKYEATDE